MSVRLVLIDDHSALREGLQLLLEVRGFEVVGAAGDADAGGTLVAELAPDVVIVDVHLGRESGIALTQELVSRHPFCRIVLYTGVHDPECALAGLEAGAMGYALKDGGPEELVEAIHAATRDLLYVDPRMRLAFDDPPPLEEVIEGKRGVLTPREREIMDLLAQGHTGEDIATLLVLSAETVKTHIRNAMVRLQAHTRVHAIALGLRDGEISPPTAAPARVPPA